MRNIEYAVRLNFKGYSVNEEPIKIYNSNIIFILISELV